MTSDRFLGLADGNSASLETSLIAFVLTSLMIQMTPRPNMAYLAVLGASRGRIDGFSVVLGVALGRTDLGIRQDSAVDRLSMELFRNQAAEHFEVHTGSPWRPRSGSMVNHRAHPTK